MLKLFDSPLSPLARKVRMVMEYKRLDFEVVDESTAEQWGRYNRRAEIPILGHSEWVLANSADIVSYLEDVFPDLPVKPAALHALAHD